MRAIMFAATSKPESSRQFYEELLGLRFVENSPYALVFDVDGVMLRLQKVEKVAAVPYTSIGFSVDDIEATIAALNSKGISFEHYDFLPQDDSGIWTTADGARVAWCRDPDGSVVSFTQHG